MTTAGEHRDLDVAFAGVHRQAELIRAGEVTSRQLTQSYLDRIARLDQRLNAYRVVFAERALAEADQADARRRAGDSRPLLGVPIAVKDDTDVAGEVTARGSIAHGPAPGQDAEIVQRLRSAGAVVLGKTNVPELMTMNFTETVWYGATRNPWDLDRTPGGSSGGTAAAVAAGLAAAATASDGAGSIRIPAACCGLVGLKPGRGRVPTPPTWHGLSTYGFITRTVADSALLYDVVKDGGGAWAQAAASPPRRALRIALSTVVPKPVLARADAEQEGAVRALAGRLRELGHEVVDRDPEYGAVFGSVIARYLRGIHDMAKAMADPERLERRTRGLARMGAAIPDRALQKALDQEAADARRINAIFDDVDLVLTPSFTRAPIRIGELESRGGPASFDRAARFTPYQGAWNHLGQPAIAIPAAPPPPAGPPAAAQLLGPPDSEPLLLSVAAQLEQVLDWPSWRPSFATTGENR